MFSPRTGWLREQVASQTGRQADRQNRLFSQTERTGCSVPENRMFSPPGTGWLRGQVGSLGFSRLRLEPSWFSASLELVHPVPQGPARPRPFAPFTPPYLSHRHRRSRHPVPALSVGVSRTTLSLFLSFSHSPSLSLPLSIYLTRTHAHTNTQVPEDFKLTEDIQKSDERAAQMKLQKKRKEERMMQGVV